MLVQIDGAGCTNKGAQLMLFSTIQAIKSKYPNSRIIINRHDVNIDLIKKYGGDNISVVKMTILQKLVRLFRLYRIIKFFSPQASFYFTICNADKNVDLVLDVGGFQFGDPWNHSEYNVRMWSNYLKKLQDRQTTHVFLPQAFGPFNKKESKEICKSLCSYSKMIFARDQVSYDYLIGCNISKENIFLYPDFTAMLSGKSSRYSKECEGMVCIIPNRKMVTQGIVTKKEYITYLCLLMNIIKETGKEPFLLNHEGASDLQLCYEIKDAFNQELKIVTGLDAIKAKGVIASSYLVISSRFHGVASALSSCVPCLATSWSHKYQKLMEDFDQFDTILDIKDIDMSVTKTKTMLMQEDNEKIRKTLRQACNNIKKKNIEMWQKVWNQVNEN